MCNQVRQSHMTDSLPFAIFPNEILDQIMRASWPGIRLGLTCRRLYSRITDELVNRWTRRVVELYAFDDSGEFILEWFAKHHELPNGTFHGRASIAQYTIIYYRGRVISCTDERTPRESTNYWYHKNMLLSVAGGCVTFENDDITVDVSERGLMFRDKSYDLADEVESFEEVESPIEWFDETFPKMCALAGDEFARSVESVRAKIRLDTSFAGIGKWPDFHDPKSTRPKFPRAFYDRHRRRLTHYLFIIENKADTSDPNALITAQIGYSINPDARLRRLRRGGRFELTLTIEWNDCDLAYGLRQKYAANHIRGKWFRFTRAELNDVIDYVCAETESASDESSDHYWSDSGKLRQDYDTNLELDTKIIEGKTTAHDEMLADLRYNMDPMLGARYDYAAPGASPEEAADFAIEKFCVRLRCGKFDRFPGMAGKKCLGVGPKSLPDDLRKQTWEIACEHFGNDHAELECEIDHILLNYCRTLR